MTTESESKLLNAYPRSWRAIHGEVLMGMIKESAAEHPELARREYRRAVRQGLALRLRRVLPYVLAIGALVSVTIAITIISTSFTNQNAPLVRALMFAVGPVLSLLAVATAARAGRSIWALVSISTAGIAIACWAHMTWYTALDAIEPTSSPTVWPLLIAIAVLLIGGAVGVWVWQGIATSISMGSAMILSVFAGLLAGAVAVPLLALPLIAPMLALAAFVIVVVLHRHEHVAMQRRAAVAA